MTFPKAFADHASSANFPTEGAMSEFGAERKEGGNTPLWDYTNYDEDVYVGYRYFDSFGKDVSYPFGYGLTYTTFDYANPTVNVNNGQVEVTVDVTNNGHSDGREVVQVYAKAPNAKEANKPEHELRAFAKTANLTPGQKQTLTMTFPVEALASFDEDASAWVVADGEYVIEIGASSRDIRDRVNAQIEGSKKEVAHRMVPKHELNLLKR